MSYIYIHSEEGSETESIAGRYFIEKEVEMETEFGVALVAFGFAVVDTSCCGNGGCRFAQVAGLIVERNAGKTEDGRPYSILERVSDEARQRRLREIIDASECHCQINFL
jgi:hypothetical protein